MKRKQIRLLILIVITLSLFTGGCKKNKNNDPVPTTKITISGRVLWGGTTEGVEQATVTLGALSTASKADGTFRFTAPAPIKGTLEINHAQCAETYSQYIDTSKSITLADVLLSRTIHVSTTGDDTAGNGSLTEPYKTVTKAFSLEGWKCVKLAAGTYGSGENFPIVLKEHDSLIGGSESTQIKHNSSIIKVEGSAVVIDGIQFRIASTAAQGSNCILIGPMDTTADAVISQCLIQGWSNGAGIYVGKNASLQISATNIYSNATGINFVGTAGKKLHVRNCKINQNAVGIKISSGYNAEVNLGDRDSDGKNDFRLNSSTAIHDSRNNDTGVIYAIGNIWSTIPPLSVTGPTKKTGNYLISAEKNIIIFSLKSNLEVTVLGQATGLEPKKYANVQVSVENTSQTTKATDSEGNASFTDLIAGEYTVGFKDLPPSVRVRDVSVQIIVDGVNQQTISFPDGQTLNEIKWEGPFTLQESTEHRITFHICFTPLI